MFKYKSSEYDFERMVMYTFDGMCRLVDRNGMLYRIGNNSFIPLSPVVDQAYKEFIAEKILLGDDDD